MAKDAHQRVVLITGASSGIGRACAEHLGRRGFRVYGTSRRAWSPPPDGFEPLAMDVDDDDSVALGVAQILEREGRLDVVVNNAGYALAGAVEETTVAEAKAQLETNFFGVLRVCRAALPAMRGRGSGTIVNIGSFAALVAIPFQGLYTASKYALDGMTECLRMEVKPFGVRVVLIEPGDICTDVTLHRQWAAHATAESAYRERCTRAVGVMEADERVGSPPEEVARLLERVISSRSPRLRYTVGPLFERVLVALSRFFPARLLEWALMAYYKVNR